MKKLLILGSVMTLMFVLTGCPGNVENVVIDYGDSKLYTTEEINKAVGLVKEEFKTLDGCTLYTLSYAGDEWSEREKNCRNSGQEETKYVLCIVLNSSFYSPRKGGGGWDANTEYTWNWIIGKETDGEWKILGYGYG